MELDEFQTIHQERDASQKEVQILAQQKATLQEEMEALRQKVESSKARAREIWRISCEQVEEFDVTLTSKDQEITQLKIQLAERVGQRVSPLPFTDNSTSYPLSSPASRESRKGRAPPIGKFSDEIWK